VEVIVWPNCAVRRKHEKTNCKKRVALKKKGEKPKRWGRGGFKHTHLRRKLEIKKKTDQKGRKNNFLNRKKKGKKEEKHDGLKGNTKTTTTGSANG